MTRRADGSRWFIGLQGYVSIVIRLPAIGSLVMPRQRRLPLVRNLIDRLL